MLVLIPLTICAAASFPIWPGFWFRRLPDRQLAAWVPLVTRQGRISKAIDDEWNRRLGLKQLDQTSIDVFWRRRIGDLLDRQALITAWTRGDASDVLLSVDLSSIRSFEDRFSAILTDGRGMTRQWGPWQWSSIRYSRWQEPELHSETSADSVTLSVRRHRIAKHFSHGVEYDAVPVELLRCVVPISRLAVHRAPEQLSTQSSKLDSDFRSALRVCIVRVWTGGATDPVLGLLATIEGDGDHQTVAIGAKFTILDENNAQVAAARCWFGPEGSTAYLMYHPVLLEGDLQRLMKNSSRLGHDWKLRVESVPELARRDARFAEAWSGAFELAPDAIDVADLTDGSPQFEPWIYIIGT